VFEVKIGITRPIAGYAGWRVYIKGWLQRRLDLGQLPAGSYTLRVVAGKEIQQQRIVLR